MFLDRISILNYKNIAQADLQFTPKINCFIGNNGEGKTNLLDAIYYLSFCKSATSALDVQIIRHGSDAFMLQGHYLTEENAEEHISIGGKAGGRKVVKRDDKAYKKMSEHIGTIPLVMVSPSDGNLVVGGSEERRRFMDQVISQYDSFYLYALIRYGRALQQRNALLRAEAEPDAGMLEVYEHMMAVEAVTIYTARQHFVEQVVPVFNHLYASIASNDEQVNLTYTSPCANANLAETLCNNRAKERIAGHTLYGIHRDDFDMTLNGYAVRREGSQGQIKTYVLALKFAQFVFLKQCKGKVPLLLLDDVFDKLDANRVERIMDLVSSDLFGQIFVTDTNRDHLDQILSSSQLPHRLFNVQKGEVTYAPH